MKIRKNDMPRKNVTCEKIIYSLAKAINNMREGNYIDCGFNVEDDFIAYLDSMENVNIIAKKKNAKKTVDLSNYIYINNPLLNFDKKSKFLKWISNNVINLIVLTINSFSNLN